MSTFLSPNGWKLNFEGTHIYQGFDYAFWSTDVESRISLPDTEKTLKKTHIEFQIEENGLCGRSLEESIKNVNRATFEITDTSTESDLEFSGTSKTEFALNLIFNTPDYSIPQYIKNGLVWLNDQKVFV